MLLLAASTAWGPSSADPAPAGDAAAPRVRVVAGNAEDSALYDWLVVRLLEEGYAVAGSDGAEIDLTIWPTEHHGWTVRAHGNTSENFGVSIGDDEAVARLELLHRAVNALESVEPRDRPEDAGARAFAIELAPTIAGEEQATIESEIALAVLDGGGSLSPDRASASFVVCAGPQESETRVDLVAADEPCPVPDPAGEDLAPPRAATQQLVEAALLSKAEPPAPEPVPEPPHDDERAPAAEPRDPPPVSEQRRWGHAPLVLRGGPMVGVIGRLTEADAVVGASMLIGREPGVSAWIDLQLWPSTMRGEPLFVFETLPAVGVRLRPLTKGRFSIDLGALVGMQTHSYRFAGLNGRDRGFALDWSLEGAAGFSVRLRREHEMQVLFRVGRSGRRRRHTSEGFTEWLREAWRVGATLGFTFGRRLRR
jgi:hypothetical protein